MWPNLSSEPEPEPLVQLEDLAILDDSIISHMVVPELKEWLRALKMTVSGRKQVAASRLQTFLGGSMLIACFLALRV